MSEPITRADLDMLVAAAIERVAKMTPAEREDMMEAQRQSWVRGELGLSKTESASPPRVPTEAEYTTAREQDRAEGYRAGIEAAAQWHDEMAFEWDGYGGSESREHAKNHRADARSIRALADKPAPDALLPGLMEARKMMTKYAAREPIMDAWDALRDKLDLEIAARKGG